MLKFRVNDTVVIRNDLVLDEMYGSMFYDECHEEFGILGEKFTIIEIDEEDSTYKIEISGDVDGLWVSQEMIAFKTDYSVGDWVKVRDDLEESDEGVSVISSMLQYCGHIGQVADLRAPYQGYQTFVIGGDERHKWNDYMVEPYYNEEVELTGTSTLSMSDFREALERARESIHTITIDDLEWLRPSYSTSATSYMPSKRKCTCEHCGKEIAYEEALKTHDGNYICSECAEADYVVCEDCGRYVLKADSLTANKVKKKTICPSCFEINYYKCSHCGVVERKNVRRMNPNGEYVCRACFDEQCTTCARCGETIWLSEAHIDSRGRRLCVACHRGSIIMGYHEFSNWQLQSTGNETNHSDVPMGIELEIERTRSSIKRESMAWKCKDILGDLAVYERDGSLDDGFEIITQPMTYDYWVNDADAKFTQTLEMLKTAGYNSHDTNTCGLHVHVGKRSLATTTRTADDVIDNIILIMETFKAELTAFSRRGSGQLGRWAQFLTTNYDDVNLYYIKEIKNSESRYRALNLQKGSTIEFRIFKGTLIKDTLYASLELVKNIVNIAKFEEVDGLTWEDVIGYDSDVNKYLTQYNQSRGITSENKIHVLDLIDVEKDKYSIQMFVDGKFAINCGSRSMQGRKTDILEYLIFSNCGDVAPKAFDITNRSDYCNLEGDTIRFENGHLKTGSRHGLKTIGLDRILKLWTDHKELLQCA